MRAGGVEEAQQTAATQPKCHSNVAGSSADLCAQSVAASAMECQLRQAHDGRAAAETTVVQLEASIAHLQEELQHTATKLQAANRWASEHLRSEMTANCARRAAAAAVVEAQHYREAEMQLRQQMAAAQRETAALKLCAQEQYERAETLSLQLQHEQARADAHVMAVASLQLQEAQAVAGAAKLQAAHMQAEVVALHKQLESSEMYARFLSTRLESMENEHLWRIQCATTEAAWERAARIEMQQEVADLRAAAQEQHGQMADMEARLVAHQMAVQAVAKVQAAHMQAALAVAAADAACAREELQAHVGALPLPLPSPSHAPEDLSCSPLYRWYTLSSSIVSRGRISSGSGSCASMGGASSGSCGSRSSDGGSDSNTPSRKSLLSMLLDAGSFARRAPSGGGMLMAPPAEAKHKAAGGMQEEFYDCTEGF